MASPSRFSCDCTDPSDTAPTHFLAADSHEGQVFANMGLQNVYRRPFCSNKELLRCRLLSSPSPPPPHVQHAKSVAWCITGNLRTFFAPLVHESMYRHAILALGGEPRAFFSAAAEDESKTGMLSHHATSSSARHSCTTRYANLTAFLSAHPEWAAITAHVSEESTATPLTRAAGVNPACNLSEIGWSMHSRDFAQLWRWHEAYAAVVHYEKTVMRTKRFDFVARLRFDAAFGAPLPSDLLLGEPTAYVSWPCFWKPHARYLPLPDHFFLVPRAHAQSAFSLTRRYRRCVGESFEQSLRLDRSKRASISDSCRVPNRKPTSQRAVPFMTCVRSLSPVFSSSCSTSSW